MTREARVRLIVDALKRAVENGTDFTNWTNWMVANDLTEHDNDFVNCNPTGLDKLVAEAREELNI